MRKMLKIVIRFPTSSRVSWLQVWKQMYSWLSLPLSTCWRWEETQREVEKRSYSRISCYSERKKVQGCVSQNSDPMDSILRKAGEFGLNASAGHTMKFWGCTWYKLTIRERKGQSGGIIQKGELHERNPCASSFEERTLEETSRQEDCDSKAAWNLARKMHMLSKRDLSSD